MRFIEWLISLLNKGKKTETVEEKVNISFSKPHRAVNKVYIHCSASDETEHDDVEVMRKWHTTPSPNDPTKPWSDIGYHYFIKKDGTVQTGRPLDRIPAAQGGHNTGSIAICLHGLKKELFTEAQFKSLKELCKTILFAYNGEISFHGHREVANKSCPVFDYKKVLNLSNEGRMMDVE